MIQVIGQALLFLFAAIGAVASIIRIIEWWKSRGQVDQFDHRELDRQSREEEQDELKRDICRTLLNEVKHNHEILVRGFEKRTRYFFLAFWNNLRTNAFVSIITSEKYVLLSSKTQNTISEYYGLVQRLNELAKELEGEDKALTIQAISNQQTDVYNKLVPLSQELILYLEEQLSVARAGPIGSK